MTKATAFPSFGVKDLSTFPVKGKKNLAFLFPVITDGRNRNPGW